MTITAGGKGFVTIPEQVNWNIENPMNELLNDRILRVEFEKGRTVAFDVTILNAGRAKEDCVITRRGFITNESDPNV